MQAEQEFTQQYLIKHTSTRDERNPKESLQRLREKLPLLHPRFGHKTTININNCR